jgi:TatD DNase family protein
VDASTIESLFRLCDAEPDFVYPMMGLHPTSVDQSYVSQLKKVEEALTQRTYCGIGEIGIDLYWDQSHLKEQKIVFEEQLRWSIAMQLPVSIHTRNAFAEVFDCIYNVGADRLKGVFHCFSGTQDDLNEIKRLSGFKIGINGVITFRKSALPEMIRQTPVDMLLLETDAPYLAPEPYRGKRNEPSYILKTAEKVASIYEMELTEVIKLIEKNTLELFNIYAYSADN